MSSALTFRAALKRFGCFGSYSIGREVHLVTGRNPQGTPAEIVDRLLRLGADEARRSLGNDNTRAA